MNGIPLDELSYPLSEFQPDGLALVPLTADDLPQPYRDLLAHTGDMTPTLEKFHGQTLGLKVLRLQRHGQQLVREVLLTLPSERPVEYGAIRINLDAVDDDTRDAILAGRRPLGSILNNRGIAHSSRPRGFFRIPASGPVRAALDTNEGWTLYGRRNTLLNGRSAVLAEIVEILAP